MRSIFVSIFILSSACGVNMPEFSPETAARVVTKAESQAVIGRFQNDSIATAAVFMGRSALEETIARADERGVWVLLGLGSNGSEQTVLVPAADPPPRSAPRSRSIMHVR
jgi:hypothetical protein